MTFEYTALTVFFSELLCSLSIDFRHVLFEMGLIGHSNWLLLAQLLIIELVSSRSRYIMIQMVGIITTACSKMLKKQQVLYVLRNEKCSTVLHYNKIKLYVKLILEFCAVVQLLPPLQCYCLLLILEYYCPSSIYNYAQHKKSHYLLKQI